MSLNLQQLAKALDVEFRGDAGLVVRGVASAKSALAGELCFVQDRKYLGDINASNCSAVILPAELAGDVSGKSLLLSGNPQYSFVEAIRALGIEAQAQDSDDIHPTAPGLARGLLLVR